MGLGFNKEVRIVNHNSILDEIEGSVGVWIS